MNPDCPACGAIGDDVHYRAKRDDWVCDVCDCVWRLEPPADAVAGTDTAPAVGAFLSYGHADATGFVRRLKADLESRGVHPVWLDSELLDGGALWTVGIEEGIRGSDALLAIMTPHALRPDSICQDEVAWAHMEGKRVVPVRVESDPSLRPSLLLVRRSWVDFTADYESSLQRLVRALRGDETALEHPLRSVAGQRPLDFSRDIAERARGFVGREWLVSELDEWLAGETGRAFVIVGEPGLGKSAIAAHLSQREDAVAVHFCSTGHGDSLAPLAFVANVVAALASRLPSFGDEVARRHPEEAREDAASAFHQLVVEPAHVIDPPEAPQLVIVDALDEAATRDGETIVDLLAVHAQSLPRWLRVVATTRPEAHVTRRLKALAPVELPAARRENLEDVGEYLEDRLKEADLGEDAMESTVMALSEKAAGNFLYAKLVADALLAGDISQAEIDALPPGLDAFYALAFGRAFPDPRAYLAEHAPVLRALAVASAPVPFAILRRATGQEASLLNLRLTELSSYTKVEGADGAATYALYHRSLGEWLRDRELAGAHWCDPAAGHEQLVTALSGNPASDAYAVGCLPGHLRALERWTDLATLLSDGPFLTAALDRDRFEVRRLWTLLAREGRPAAEHYDQLLGASTTPDGLRLRIGVLLHELEAFDRALRVFEDLADSARAGGDRALLHQALGRQALIHRRWGDDHRAMSLHKEEEALCRDLEDPYALQACLGRQGLILRRWGDLHGAMALHEEEARISRELEDPHRLQISLGNQALILRRWCRLEEAMELFKTKERICRERGNPAGLHVALGGQALILRDWGDLEGAMRLQKEKEHICREYGVLTSLQLAFADQADILQDLGDLKGALELRREQERLCRELKYTTGLHGALGGQARILYEMGDLPAATTLFEEQEHMCREMTHPDGLHRALRGRALVLRDLGDLDGAAELLEEAETICRKTESMVGIQEALLGRASVAHRRGDEDEALRLADEALALGSCNAAVTRRLLELRDCLGGSPNEE